MPLKIRDPFTPAEAYTVGIGAHDRPEPTFLQGLTAALRDENQIGSALVSYKTDQTIDRSPLPGYDPFTEIKGYEDHSDRFIDSPNPTITGLIKTQIDRETADDRTLDEMGLTGYLLRIGAGIADPTILLPGGALVRAGRVGYRVGKTALTVGAASGAAVAIQEAGLQELQETRTTGESTIAIGGSVILGALLGTAGARMFTKAEWGRVAKGIENDLAEEAPNAGEIAQTIVQRMQAVGADSVDKVKLDDLGVGGPRAAQAVARATAALRVNPGVEMMFSPSARVREVHARMMDNAIYSKMNMEGKSLGADVENLVKVYTRGAVGQWVRSSKSLFKQAKRDGFEGSRHDFNVRVARAGRRGDVDELGDEFVTRAAREAREKIFDPLLVRAQQARLLGEDVKVTTALSYVTRMWNPQRLIGEEDRFRDIAREYFRKEIAKIPEDMRPGYVSKADMESHVETVVSDVFNNLTGKGGGDVPEWIVPSKAGPLKERTFNIPDELVEDFLENDMELILRNYSRKMAADVELTEKFGSPDMKQAFDDIRADYEGLRAQAKTPKERLDLNGREKRDIEVLEAFRDQLRGTYLQASQNSNWGKLTRAALAWNYMRLLGGVVMTSLTDMTNIIGKFGLRAVMREALPALISGVRAAKISRQDARDLGPVTEVVNQSRLASLAELQDPYRYGSTYERMLANATNIFSKATGLSYWNDMVKTIAAVMTQNRLARTVVNWEKASKSEKAFAAMLGVNENVARDIAKQIKAHGIQERGIWGADVSKWDDDVTRRAWAAALNKATDTTIVTKGHADQPLWTKTNWGKLLTQFKTFGMASHQKILISGLQNNPHRLAEMMAFATPLGMLIAWLKYVERGDDEEANRLLENPGLWIAEGLDRSGILMIPFEVSNTAEKLGIPGLVDASQAIAGDPDRGGSLSRYAGRNRLGAVMGPSASIYEDVTMFADQLASGDIKKSGANAAIRQIPFGTLPGIKTGLHMYVRPALQDLAD